MDNLESILKEVMVVVKKAGEAILDYYEKGYKIKKKANQSPVTEADLAAEKIILAGLDKYGYGILSEESRDDKSRLNKKRVWLIDPLDGTCDFIKKTGEFTVMVGLVEKSRDGKWRPVLGVVYKPVGDELYYACRGIGAFLLKRGQKRRLKVSSRGDGDIKMVSSRFHQSRLEKELAHTLGIKEMVACGSAGLKISLIAAGTADLNVNPSSFTYEWDIAAADIILRQAGGRLTDMYGLEFTYNKPDPQNKAGYAATNGKIHQEVIRKLDLLAERGKM